MYAQINVERRESGDSVEFIRNKGNGERESHSSRCAAQTSGNDGHTHNTDIFAILS